MTLRSSDCVVTASRLDRSEENLAWAHARVRAHACAVPIAVTRCSLASASGATLAEDLVARAPLPAFDTAAMDGYAVAGPGPHTIVGAVLAGTPTIRRLGPGQAVVIATGAAVPLGARAVWPREQVQLLDPDSVIGPVVAPGSHIRRRGEDAERGDRLVSAGRAVGPAVLGLAAAAGYDTIAVRRKPAVRILVTGDELLHAGLSGDGMIRDALRPMLTPLVDGLGGRVTSSEHLADSRPGGLAEAVSAFVADDSAGVLVVTGSTSHGPTDQLRRVLRQRAATWLVGSVACRPGHPQLLAELAPGRWVVGLPGNPFAALVAAHTLLGPLLAGLAGRSLPQLPTAAFEGAATADPQRTRLVPAMLTRGVAVSLGRNCSAFLGGAATGDVLAVLTPDWTLGGVVSLIATN